MAQTIIISWLLACLAVISYTDLRRQIIPDICLLLMLPAGFFSGAVSTEKTDGLSLFLRDTGCSAVLAQDRTVLLQFPGENEITGKLSAALLPLVLYALMAVISAVFHQDCPVGMGDAKLLAVMGFLSGTEALAFTALAGSLLCGAAAALLLLLKKATKKSRIAFGPFLAAAYAAYLLL